jgi:polysaccharide biosynthesis transport protein
MTPAAPVEEKTTLDQILLVLRRRWHVIVLCAVLVTVAAVAVSEVQRKEYTSSSSLLFQDTQFDQELFGTNFTPQIADPTREAATNLSLVSLPTVAARAAAALHTTTTHVQEMVTVQALGQANLVAVSATSASPAYASTVANTYAQQFVLFRQDADRSKLAGAETLIRTQLARLTTAQRTSTVGAGLQNRANQLGILAALQTGNAEVVQTATAPRSPSSPQTRRNAFLGFILGLLLGVGLAFVVERRDRRIREPEELEQAYGVPILGSVPASDKYEIAGTEPLPAAEAEAFALLRARLRYFNVDREIRSLLVTSSIPGEGKTTVSLNLAMAEATAGHVSVVLIEADLRRSVLAKRLGIASAPGLAEVLSRNATTDEALREVSVPGRSNGSEASFFVMPAGAMPPNPAELIESRAMIELLSELSERFGLVIIDSPPTGVVSDAIPLMRLVSGVVIVGRINRTTRDAARHLHEHLANLHAPALGVIANADIVGSRGYYGYGYLRDGYLTEPPVNGADPSGGAQNGAGADEESQLGAER